MKYDEINTIEKMNDFLAKDAPRWIEQKITTNEIISIEHGGCACGVYMPAIVGFEAQETMSKFGDEVLEYIEEHLGEIPIPTTVESWSELACFYLSMAVEMWANQHADKCREILIAAPQH